MFYDVQQWRMQGFSQNMLTTRQRSYFCQKKSKKLSDEKVKFPLDGNESQRFPTQRQITRRTSRHLRFHDLNQSCEYSISDRNISQWHPWHFHVVWEPVGEAKKNKICTAIFGRYSFCDLLLQNGGRGHGSLSPSPLPWIHHL